MTTTGSPRPVEIELKYRVHDGPAAERYLEADTLATFVSASTMRPRKVEDRYVDTADGDFAKAGLRGAPAPDEARARASA